MKKVLKKVFKVYVLLVVSLLVITLLANAFAPELALLPGGVLYVLSPNLLASVEHLMNKALTPGFDCRVVNLQSKDGKLVIGVYHNGSALGMHVRNDSQYDYACPQCRLIAPSLVIQYKNFFPTRIEMIEKSFRSYVALAYMFQALNTKRMIYMLSQ